MPHMNGTILSATSAMRRMPPMITIPVSSAIPSP